jgi:hypothetical protein
MNRILVGLGRKLVLLCIGAIALTMVWAVPAFGAGFVQQGGKIIVGDDSAKGTYMIGGGGFGSSVAVSADGTTAVMGAPPRVPQRHGLGVGVHP